MTEVDPDPFDPSGGQNRSTLGGREEPATGDPTEGGRSGQIGEVPSIAADEPDDGGLPLAPGGGRVTHESSLPPVADPGPDA